MDWIERIFSIAPDGGSGVTELLLVLALGLVVIAAISVRRRRRSRLL
jgi:MYXO-CTERM domain-containing protein